MRVLLIEDSPIDSYLIRGLLSEVRDADLDLECTDRLSTGLERLEEGDFDVVLLDLVLPDSQGLDTFIKAHRYAPEMPILVLTCLDDETLAVQAVQAGAQDYLFKWEFDGHLMVRAMRYAIERKRAGEELKELMRKIERAKQEWESTADSLSELVCLVDARGHIIRTNRTVETWDLAQAVNVRGREFHELLHPGCTDSSCYLNSFWEQAWEEALRGQPTQCEAYDEVLKRHVLIRVRPWKDWGKGTAAGFTVVVVRDITERKRAEESLRGLLEQIERIKQEWESTADSLPELVCLVDDQGRIIRANRTMETWNLGRVVDVRGRGFHELLHPGCTDSSCYLNSFWEQAWEKAAQGQPAQCEAYDEILKRYVLVQVQPGEGTVNGSTVVVVQDITERKRAEKALKEYSERLEEMVDERTKELRDAQERLLRAERLAAIGQLGASVGHELRNPLGIIKNSAYYVNMKLQDADEKVKKHLGIIEKEIARSNKIISDLMNFARDKKLALQKTQINAIVQDALSRTPVPDTVAVIVKLGGDLPPLMADPSQIEQVFINVIANAAQAMTSSNSIETRDGGKLEISTRAEDGFVVAEFKDNGCGISEENLDRLFEPLFTTKTKGIGLGLAVSKRVVEAHEGRIEVESEVGRGTVFVIKLPASVNQIPDIKRS